MGTKVGDNDDKGSRHTQAEVVGEIRHRARIKVTSDSRDKFGSIYPLDDDHKAKLSISKVRPRPTGMYAGWWRERQCGQRHDSSSRGCQMNRYAL